MPSAVIAACSAIDKFTASIVPPRPTHAPSTSWSLFTEAKVKRAVSRRARLPVVTRVAPPPSTTRASDDKTTSTKVCSDSASNVIV